MPPDAAATHENMLKSAKAEFLAKGFSGASLRTIAAGAGITTGALYRHFDGKAALFDALVAPCVHDFIGIYRKRADEYFLELNDSMDWASSEDGLLAWVQYMYDHLDVFKLLLGAAEKSAYENFTHMMVDMETETTLNYLAAARARGYPVNEISREELHMFTSAQFSVLFEMVLHNVPREKAIEYTQKMNRFFTAGWRALFTNG